MKLTKERIWLDGVMLESSGSGRNLGMTSQERLSSVRQGHTARFHKRFEVNRVGLGFTFKRTSE